MNTRRDQVYESVEGVLRHIALQARPRLDPHGIIFNERYLHHEFSHRYQTLFPASNQLISDIALKGPEDSESALHPEWPTKKEVKVENRIDGGKYSGHKPVKTSEAGTAGHIDFAVGPYRQPWLAIEFKLTLGWSGKAVGFDLVKLLDRRNRFERVVSFNVILRSERLGSQPTISEKIAETYRTAVRKLDGLPREDSPSPFFWFVLAEIAPEERRIFQCWPTGAVDGMGELQVVTIQDGSTLDPEIPQRSPVRP